MKRIFALMLALIMALTICGCSTNNDDNTSQVIEYEHQQIVVDENGNEVVSKPTESSKEEDTNSSVDTPKPSTDDTSSDTTSNYNPIKIDYNTTVEVDICNDIIRGYLDATTASRQFDWLTEYSGQSYDTQDFELDWYVDGSTSYKITFSENADFSNSHTIETKFTDIKNSILVPGKTYYWKVTGTWSDTVLGGGKIHVVNSPVRWIKVNGTANVRDMGGWKTASGKTVKYGMLYRGQRIENITSDGIETFKQLGMKTELDLRYKDQKFQTPGTGLKYEFIEMPGQYTTVLTSNPEIMKASYKRIFELLSDESNYPFYTHCNAGADRTGTFAFIVNGLLGVSYEDLTRDFELTSFSASGKRWRSDGPSDKDGEMTVTGNTVAWGKLYDEMMKHGKANGCTTLQSSIEHWLTSYVGVPQAQIDSFKRIMLQ